MQKEIEKEKYEILKTISKITPFDKIEHRRKNKRNENISDEKSLRLRDSLVNSRITEPEVKSLEQQNPNDRWLVDY